MVINPGVYTMDLPCELMMPITGFMIGKMLQLVLLNFYRGNALKIDV
jgi:hypothetical protein